MSTSRYIIPESETEVYYPKSKRKVKLDSKGNVISDSAAAKDKKDKGKEFFQRNRNDRPDKFAAF